MIFPVNIVTSPGYTCWCLIQLVFWLKSCNKQPVIGILSVFSKGFTLAGVRYPIHIKMHDVLLASRFSRFLEQVIINANLWAITELLKDVLWLNKKSKLFTLAF